MRIVVWRRQEEVEGDEEEGLQPAKRGHRLPRSVVGVIAGGGCEQSVQWEEVL